MPYPSACLRPLLFALLCTPLLLQAADPIAVDDPYARAVPPGQPNSAVFMALTNPSGEERALVAAESPAAAVVELHTHRMDGGMMRMRRVERIALPPGERVVLEPGGRHLMLIGLQRPLAPGETVALTLTLDDGSRVPLEAPVRPITGTVDGHRPRPADD